tara:strand:+ start:1152 stop:1640 length:489 start_codon:yes stop_codon:yes gene_type:complete
MEQKKFIQVLKKIVKEEVRSVIKEELTEILQEGLKSTISELRTKQPIQEVSTPRRTNKNVTFKENKFSNILNETDSLREQSPVSNYASLMTEDINMTSADAQGFPMMRQSFKEAMGVAPEPIAVLQDPETGKNMKVDPIIAKAMTKDYSALMKAIDSKKSKR